MSAPDQRATEGPQREKVLAAKLREHLNESAWEKYQEKRAELESVDRELSELPKAEVVLAVAKCDAQPRSTHVLMRGNPHSPGDEVSVFSASQNTNHFTISKMYIYC